jgi:hypothetical protein
MRVQNTAEAAVAAPAAGRRARQPPSQPTTRVTGGMSQKVRATTRITGTSAR